MDSNFVALLLTILVSWPKSETANITAFIDQSPSPTNTVEGQNFTLVWTYTLDGTVGLANFKIIKDGIELLIGKKFGPGVTTVEPEYQARFKAQATNTRAELTILSVRRSDEATYRMSVNPTGTGSLGQSVVVSVYFPTKITEISGNQTVTERGNVTLNCLADGKPTPNITWTRLFDNRVVTMPLTDIRRQDTRALTYRCTADNKIGTPATADVYVDVQYPLEVTGSGQNVSLAEGDMHMFSCPVDGNPEPVIEWYNEFGKKISSDKQLKAKESGCYTCVAKNPLGTPVNVTQCLTISASLTTVPPSTVPPGEKVKAKIKARIKIERKYQGSNQEFVLWFKEEMDKIYENMPEYKRTLVIKTDLRPASVTVYFILHFTTLVTPEKGLEKLNATLVLNSTFGGFKAEDLALLLDESTTSTTRGSPKPTVSAGIPWTIIGAVAGGVVLLTILVGVLTWWVHKKRKCRKDTKIHNADPRRHDNEGGYSQVQGAYAQSGPPAANGTDGAAEQEIEAAAAAIPTYAVVDKSKKSKKQADEKPPEYAVVDKSTKKEKQEAAIIPTYAAVDKSKKKKKPREEVSAVYAEVDKSKKKKKKKIDDKNLYENLDEPKKEKKPGELLYADLGDFQNPSIPAVSISPQPLPAIKKTDPYERTDYADITQFLKGNATLPPNDGNGDAEMKPKRPSKKKEIQGNDKETPI